jgi:hybrid polyketide synthase/nonribosomal peptide synthetase ACE1
MPSATAQADLIRQTYDRAGLDPLGDGRPQYFEAHGTGTPAGDPIEAEAISRSFTPGVSSKSNLYVGSIKTVLGHTEGTAGVASLMKASLALQNEVIPPNLLFNKLSSSIEPFYNGLEVPTEPQRWPALQKGQPRRASVNSFGFGGANAHAILESYDQKTEGGGEGVLLGPYVFSAGSEQSLVRNLEAYLALLDEQGISATSRDLAWTLRKRRSALPLRMSFPAGSIEQLRANIKSKLLESQEQKTALGTRSSLTSRPRILGIFTGQGAQYACMGAELFEKSQLAGRIINELESHLACLPESDRPAWSLTSELRAGADISRLDQAELSQPLCTALQIVLVELLRAAGVEFSGVIGHSSGEIGAAYAAGYISRRDAMYIAYYRGLHSSKAASPNGPHIKGSMLAVGTSKEDAEDILSDFIGQATIAASNSSSSVTLSGDEEAIDELDTIFGDENKFRRKLRVNKAYHSAHMLPCSQPYIKSLEPCGTRLQHPSISCTWYSTVYETLDMRSADAVSKLRDGSYWADNMVLPVMFLQGLQKALVADTFDIAVEVGPHPALNGPATQTIKETLNRELPYGSLLKRGKSPIEAFSDCLGFLWRHEGPSKYVQLDSFEDAATESNGNFHVVKGLPTYRWNHDKVYWHESRRSRNMRARKGPVHPLLGHEDPDSSAHQRRWRNVLQERELPWLSGHQLQGRTVFPATGYISILLEAARSLLDDGETARLIEISGFNIYRATTFDEDDSGVEILVGMDNIYRNETRQVIEAQFTFSSSVGKEASSLAKVASATVEILLGQPDAEILPAQQPDPTNLVDVTEDRFYGVMADLGYGYSGQFRTLSNLKRKLGVSVGRVAISRLEDKSQEPLLGHPGTLDCALQAILLAFSYPGDSMLWSLHVPTSINRIRVNPALCGSAWDHAESVPIRAATSGLDGAGLVGDAEVFGSSDSAHAAVQIEGLRAIPFVGATTADDNQMFARMKWSNMSVDPEKATEDSHDNSFQKGLAEALERTSLFYLRKFQRELPKDHPAWNDPVFSHYLKFSNHMTGLLDSGSHKYARREWANDTLEEILTAAAPYMETIDMKLILTTANAMPKVFNGEENILEHLLSSGLLDEQYVSGMGFRQSAAWLGSIVKQISHRYPQMNILEVGAGTGGATKQIFKNIGPDDFSSFTYTDISTGFFEEAATVFAPYKGRMIFKALDANADPASQGFTPASYDLIVGWFVIHATPNLENTLRNLRRLLRPGGLLVLGEFIGHDWTRDGFVFGTMPGWWAGVAEGRELSPCVSAEHWDEVLRASGFSGVDVITSQDACHDTHSASIFVSQAVDDTITYLREPLVSPLPVSSLGDGLPLHDLIIVGGSSLRTSRLVTQVKDSLSRFAVKLRSFKSLSDVPFDDDVSLDTTFVCLSELDKPVFETLNNTSFAAMKRLVSQEYTVLWVTEGRRTGKNPYVSMGISFVQTASHEVPGLNVQCIDFESKGGRNLDARALAEQVLRFHNLSARPQDQTSTEIMWSVDPEIVIDSECNYLIPRFEPQSSLNDRYNSFKRVVTRDVTVADAVVAVHRDKNGDYSLHEESIFAESTGSTSGDDVVELRVSYAAVTPINTFLGPRFVTLGVESSSGNRHVTLANKIASVVSVNKSSLVLWGATSTTVPEDQQLALLTANLYAGAILEHSLPGESLVVHNATAPAAAALARRAADIGVQVTFTASSSHEEPQVKRVIIPSYTTQREVRELLPSDITRFVSFTRAENDANIISCLPTYCRIETAIPTVCGEIPYSPPSSAASACLKDIISKALDCTRNDLEAEEVADSGYLVYPEDIIKETNANENHQSDRVPVISWLDTSALLPVRVSRLDTKFMFKSDKTYWLVGLSRDLGLSICDWMVSKGAKHIVITSRNPKVDAAWEEGWRRQGVQIKIMANNIRDAADVERVYKTIHKTLPPLAGVMQGAMVLKDRAVRDMSLEDMLTVLGPKVEGSLNLERVLGSTQLDFLVYLSSMARVLCNLGQVNYSAANAFMASLAIQRRRRGLAASVANISVVAGAGYVQRVGGDDGDNFIKLTGLRRVSEVDVHQQLAEAIVMGRSDLPLSPDEDAEIGGGLRTISLQDEEFLPYWTANPKFARFVRNKQETEDTRSGSNRTAGRSISERLEGANSEKQVYDMIKGE